MTATPVRPAQLTIASVPQGHVYVRHLSPPGDGDQRHAHVRLPDPVPPEAAAVEQWWPPVMLDPEWAGQAEFDLFHLHFGFDSRTPEQLQRLVDVLADRGKPLVQTVHDLRNPHHEDRSLHDAQLDVLVPAAAELITLTRGAAEEIRRRWGRDAVVIPHPHVVPFDTMEQVALLRSAAKPERFRVGLHVKSLRASMDPMALLPTLVRTVAGLDHAVLQVNAHRDVMSGGARHAPELAGFLRDHAAAGDLELVVHDYLPDDGLWDYLASLDVSVLPYRFGTHSGWLEACRDLGTGVIAPTCGYYADQGPVLSYENDEKRLVPETLALALRQAHGEWKEQASPAAARAVTAEWRRRQRMGIAVAHDLVYRAALRSV